MWKETLRLRAFAWLRIPMIAYVRPRVVAADDDGCTIAIPLTRRTKNHLGTMYFGALSVGADLAAGYIALDAIRTAGRKVSFVFQASEAQFLRRPDGTVHFHCPHGKEARALVERSLADGQRHAARLDVICTVPSESDAPVARFALTLSVKAK